MLIAKMTDGRVLKRGDTIVDFRGNTHIYHRVAAGPAPGKSAKIETDHGIFYVQVFDNVSAGNDEDEDTECEGHESLDGAHMGEAVYCDGSCRSRRK